MEPVPIYSEEPPGRGDSVAPRWPWPLLAALLAGAGLGALLRPLPLSEAPFGGWGQGPGAGEAILALVLMSSAAAGLWAVRRRAAVRSSVGIGWVAAAIGGLAWVLLALAGGSLVAAGEVAEPGGAVLRALAAASLVALGEAALARLTLAPWPRPLAPGRPSARWALRSASWLAALLALMGWPHWIAAQALVGAWAALLLGAVLQPLLWPDRGRTRMPRGELSSRRARCQRCGTWNDFARGVSPCTLCGLLVRWDGEGEPAGGADRMDRSR